MSEEYMVRFCSPTLAGLKTGNLFSYVDKVGEDVAGAIRNLNRRLSSRGIRVLPVKTEKNRTLIYVYRPKRLKEDFADPSVRKLLRELGYPAENPSKCIALLIERLKKSREFPHEIGLFLSYPAEDVRGFMEHKAACSKCVGCWKVYGDEAGAKKQFARYDKCTDIYCRLWKEGRSIEKLTVTV